MATEVFSAQKAAEVSAAGVVKAKPGRLVTVVVVVAGSGGTLTVHDNASAASGTRLLAAPGTAAQGTVYQIDLPATAGIYVTPGTGQVVTVGYS